MCALIFLVLLMIVTACPSAYATGWFSPVGTDAPDGQWGAGNNAIDGNTTTYASHTSPGAGQWGAPLWLTNSTTFTCSRVKLMSDWDTGYIDAIRLEIRLQPSGTWTNVYEGSVLNIQWSEIDFPSSNIDAARYSYHYVAGSIIFWLYEFMFYEDAAQINLPSCTSDDATSVEETSGILHGTVVDDGGEPCQYRFQYGLTTSYSTNTEFNTLLTTNNDFSTLLTGLATNTTFHFRAQVRNSRGTSSGDDKTFTSGPPNTGWVSPTGYANSGIWTNIPLALDDDLDSSATCYHNINDQIWSPYLYLTHSTMTCETVRFYARKTAEIDVGSVDVDLNGTWTNVYYSNTFPDKQWVEVSFPQGTVSQARMQFSVTATTFGMDWQVYEFDFYRVVGVTLSGSFNGSSKVSLAINGQYRASFTNFTTNVFSFATSVGAGDEILIFYDDDNIATNSGALVTRATGADMTNLDLTANTLILRSDYGAPLTCADLAMAYTNDADVCFTPSGNDIAVTNNIAVWIPAGNSFSLGTNSLTLMNNLVTDGSLSNNGTVVFAGTTTLSGATTPAFKNVTISGTLTSNTNLIQVSGNWVNNGTFNPTNGTVEFNGSTAINGASVSSFNNVTLSGSLTAPVGTLNVAGNFVNNGTFNDNAGTVVFNGTSAISGSSATTFSNMTISAGSLLTAPSGSLSIEGNWSNSGSFSNNNGTIVFVGPATSTILGSNTFYNLTCTTPGKQINFAAGTNETVQGTFTVTGSAGSQIDLRSTTGTNKWFITFLNGPQSVTYVDVRDSDALSNTVTVVGGTDSGNNNTNWIFASNRYWVGGAGNWSDTNHWSAISGGPPGVSVPNSGNLAIFDANSGSSAQCTIDQAVDVKGLLMDTLNSMTLSQGTNAIVVRSAGFEEKAGVFTGGSGSIDAKGTFKLSGGIFKAPSSTLYLESDMYHTGGVFSNNTGTVAFIGSTVINDTISDPFANIVVSNSVTAPAGTMYVSGNWTDNGTFNRNNGTIVFSGTTVISGVSTTMFNNVTISGGLTGNAGSFGVAGAWVNNGVFNPNAGTVIFPVSTLISGSSTSTFNNVTITGTLTGHSSKPVNITGNWINNGTFNQNGGTVVFAGNTTIGGTNESAFNNVTIQGVLTAPTGTVRVAGNWVNNGVFSNNNGTVIFNGTTAMSGTNATYLGGVEIWGTLTAPATNLYVSGNWVNHYSFINNGGTVVFNGTTLLSGSYVSDFSNVTISGTVQVDSDNRIGSGSAVTVSGTLNLAGKNDTIASLSGGGQVLLGSGSLTVSGGASTTYSGTISQTGALSKQGGGTLTLSGTNTYSGTTVVSNGTLLVNGSLNGSGQVTTTNSGTLGGTGTVAGAVFINNGGTLRPGTNGDGTLTLTNGLTFDSSAFLVTVASTTAYGQVHMTGGEVQIGPSSTINISSSGYSASTNDILWLINNQSAGAMSGTFANLASGAQTNIGGIMFTADYSADYASQSLTGGNDLALDGRPRSDLGITKDVSTNNPGTNELIGYAIRLTNSGPQNASGIAVTEMWPTNIVFSNAWPSVGTYNSTNKIWTVGSLNAGRTATLVITGRVSATKSGISITNTAYVSALDQYDPNTGNNTGRVTIVTLVVLSRLEAQKSGGQVVLDWETASEIDTAGFYVYRKAEGGDGFMQINKDLLPAVVGSPQGGIYRFTDTTYAPGKTCTYRLVEVETSGKRNICGDCALSTEKTGLSKNLVSLKSAGPAYSNAARTSELKKARTELRNAEIKSLQPATPLAREPGGIGGSQVVPALANIKIKLTANGVYYIGASDIAAELGTFDTVVDIAIAGGGVSLSHDGNEVAYLPAAGGQGIYFYGQALESLYGTQNVYLLTWQGGTQMATETLQTPGQAATDETFVDTLHVEQDWNSAPGFFTDPTADYWFWDYLVGGQLGKSFTVHLDGVAAVTGENATLKVSLFGATSTDVADEHHAVISLNGTQVGEVQWDGLTATNITCTFDQSLLVDGDNTVGITDVLDSGAPYSTIYLDSFDATWHRLYEAVNNQLLLRGDDNAVVTVNGFTSTNIQVFDVSNPLRPELVAGTTVEQTGACYRVSFVPAASNVPYVAFASWDTPVSVAADSPFDLKATTNEAQYVVITVPELKPAAQALADYRGTKGLKTMVVLLDDIYDEFNAGLANPEAIRAFLTYATFKWQTGPRYVVLAGEGSYDYRNVKGYGDSIIPPIMVGTPNGLFASDGRYADLNDDGAPELAVGRLPAMTDAELQGMVDKIIVYESSGEEDWQKRIILAADNADDGGDFETSSEQVGRLIPGGYTTEKVYLTTNNLAEARSNLLQDVNAGALFMNYFGHSGIDRLATEGLLTSADLGLLTNKDRYPVLTAMSCVMGQFAVPGYDCLGETLMVSSNSGAIAVWSPSGLSLNNPAETLCEGFYGAMFNNGEGILGDAVLKALRSYEGSGRAPYMLGIYNLLGDPGLMISELQGTYEGKSVIVGNNGTPLGWSYGAWERIEFLSDEMANPMISDAWTDPDGDGVPNFIEYAFGRNPRVADRHYELGIDHLRGAPDAGYDVQLTFKRLKLADDVYYVIEVSPTLFAWYDGAGYILITSVTDDGNGSTETVNAKVKSPTGNRRTGFMRLRAVQTPPGGGGMTGQ
jgi:autotransporter-associated beta strand protein